MDEVLVFTFLLSESLFQRDFRGYLGGWSACGFFLGVLEARLSVYGA